LKFSGNSNDFYNLEDSLINEVLDAKKGIPITLCVVYAAICQRLGIHLEPVNFPSHFVMRWKIPGEEECEYIDAFHKGRRLTGPELTSEFTEAVRSDPSYLNPCSKVQVFQRIIRNIMTVPQMQAHVADHMELFSSATELLSIISPTERGIQETLVRLYYTLEIHYDRIVEGCKQLLRTEHSGMLEEMLADCERVLAMQSSDPKPIIVNKRCKEIKYATGLVMKHKRYNYQCVIFGWDKTCQMSDEWVHRMGVHNLKYKTEQPFYNVLVYDGSRRYAAQEYLEIELDPKPITHIDVGKFFKSFTGKHYTPNAELQEEYPDDNEARRILLQQQGIL
ncbi:F-box protein 21, partial [Halocaridina rubra]